MPHAWGLTGNTPYTIWERFSPAYEAQAEFLWHAFAGLGLTPELCWAGSEDGEAIIGTNKAGEISLLFHLEDPKAAEEIENAIAKGELLDLFTNTVKALRRP